MKTQEDMIALNRTQAVFYDKIHEAEKKYAGSGGYKKNEKANLITRGVAALRHAQYNAVTSTGIRDRERRVHLDWAAEKAGGRFLEIGCQHGSIYTFDLIEASGNFTGVELSSLSCDALRRKIADRGLSHKATIICGDLLEFEPDRKFDFIYANGVLHHFENPDPLFAKIRRLLADDGYLVFVEPVAINRVYRALRSVYRPFQSDAAWEWPFREQTVAELTKRFKIVDGFGWGRFSAPVSVLCGVPVLGSVIAPGYRWVARRELSLSSQKSYWQNSTVVSKCVPL
jgi:SAM-dependent methyltransferase